MSLCTYCGVQVSGPERLCTHHHDVSGDDWAAVNRLMCDLFHRGRAPNRLEAADRHAEDPEPTQSAA